MPGVRETLTSRQPEACSNRSRARLSGQRKANQLRVLAQAAPQATEELQGASEAKRRTGQTRGGRKPMTAWRAILMVLCLGVLAAASSAEQGAQSEAQELARLSFASGQFDQIRAQAAKVGVLPLKTAIEGRLGRQLSEDELRRLTEVFTRVFKESIPQSEYEDNLAGQLSRYYSQQELADLLAFYRTPLGMKALRFASTAGEENALMVQRLMASRQAEFIERFNAEFAREFPKLSEEMQRKSRH